jgi:O-antigen/teichoic acid export membrane protein
MSRKRRFIFALGSGYAALAANIVYTASAIPLALHYLGREEFGLWSVVLQITGYLTLLDLGVGHSVARILVETKDDINGGIYGSILKTASIVFAIQACIVASFGFLFSHPISYLMGIPPNLRSTFEALMHWQCVTLSIGCLATPFGDLPLWSHQRLDLSNFANLAVFAANFLFLWIGFQTGLRTFSLLLSNVAGTVVYVFLVVRATTRLKLLPSRGHWGTISWERSGEIFRFSRDIFVTRLAAQLIYASQIILVSRLISLDAAGVWSVCTKSYSMALLVVCRVNDFSSAGFSEMIVRGEIGRFRSRLASIVALSAVGAGFFAVLGACGNRSFVNFWTGGKVSWDMWSDVVAAAYLFSVVVTRCYFGLTALVKQIGNYKYVSLLEGVLVIAGSIILAPRLHFFGVLLSSLLANSLCSGAYGAFRVSRYFNTSIVEVTFGWLKGALLYLVTFALAGFGIFWLGNRFSGPLPFLITAGSAGLTGMVLAILFGLPSDIRKELILFGTQLGKKVSDRKRPTTSSVSEPVLPTAIENDFPPPCDADRSKTNSQ